MRFRLFHVLAISAIGLLALKVNGIVDGYDNLIIPIQEAKAQEAEAPESGTESMGSAGDNAGNADDAGQNSGNANGEELTADKSANDETQPAAGSEQNAPEDTADSDAADSSAADSSAADSSADGEQSENKPATDMPMDIGNSLSERKLLEKLSARRQQIDRRDSELTERERLLALTENRIGEKIKQLENYRDEIREENKQIEEEEKNRTKALITIYESMKPKDAARIFNTLDIAVLSPMAQNMAPKKLASILAKMSDESAQALTIALSGLAQTKKTRPQLPADDNILPKIGTDTP